MDFERLRTSLSGREIGPIDGRPPCAVLAPLVEHNGELCLLYEVRAAGLRWQPGEICFPGGRMERGETPLDCALRETEEELGLDRDKIEVLGAMDYAIHASGFPVFPYLAHFHSGWESALRLNAAEVDSLLTIPLSYLRYTPPQKARVEKTYHSMDILPEAGRTLLEDHPRLESMPTLFWPYEGKLLWGMTARVTEWLLRWLERHG